MSVNIVVKTDAGLSDSFDVKVGFHQGLYADDLVLMAPTMEQLCRRVAEWRVSLLNKGFKVNAGKSKVMVGSNGVKMIVTPESGPVVSVGKEYRQTLFSGFVS